MTSVHSALARVTGAAARMLLRLYPRRFRTSFGSELLADVELALREAGRRGRLGTARTAIVAIGEVAAGAPLQWLAVGRHRGQRRASVRRRGDRRVRLLWSDIRIGFRRLRRTPVFSLAVMSTIALGIGLNTAMFSIVKAVVLDPLPYDAPDDLVAVYTRSLPSTGYDFPYSALSGPELLDLSEQVPSLSVSAYRWNVWNAAIEGSDAERVPGISATANLFAVLGVQAALGRTFSARDDAPAAPCVTVLSDGFWRDRFAGAADVVGRDVRLDGRPCRIIGVMPPGFMFPNRWIRLWTTLVLGPTDPNWDRQSHYFSAVARLAPSQTIGQADAELTLLWKRWSLQFPDHYAKGHFAVLRSLKEDLLGDLQTALLVLLGAVAFVLLIVCANLAGLLLSRAEGRRREGAIRSALGAGRARLLQQLLTEHLLLAVTGGALGLLVARALLPLLLTFYAGELPRGGRFVLDGGILLFTCLAIVLAGLVFALAPAIRATRAEIRDALGAEGRGTSATRSSVRTQSVLVVAEVALSVVLVTGAILLLRSYAGLRQLDAGFDPRGVLTFQIYTPSAAYPNREQVQQFHATLRERLGALPGVAVAGATSDLPLQSGGGADDFDIEGAPPPGPGEPGRNARYVMVTPGAFEALRVPLRRGRLITESDAPGRPLVAVINEAAARTYWAGADPIGARIGYGPSDERVWITVVGVVGDVRSDGLAQPAPPAVYAPLAQASRRPYEGRTMTFVLRSQTSATALAGGVRRAVGSLDPALPVDELLPMTAVVDRAADQPRFAAYLMTFFALSALFLGAIGIYGVLANAVERRQAEIGVRIALGADRARVFRMVVSQGLMLAAVGAVCGIAIALAVARALSTLLHGISPMDPLTLAAVPILLVAVAFVAGALPALRATRVDPVTALRGE
ncbi:MAG: ABC transporter permease [Vicinamibacteraceae bacterium]